MKIALIQVASPQEEPEPDRVARVGALLDSIDEVDLIVLPELWACGYFAFDHYRDSAQQLNGPLTQQVAGWARRLRTPVQMGSLVEQGDDGRLFNTALLLDADGEIALEYRKMHVFGYQSLEAQLLTAGDQADVQPTQFARVGMTTCYDLRFPELYRVLTEKGAEFLLVPAAWPAARLEHWRLLTRARALENQAFLIACNAAGRQGEVDLAGHSCVIDPWGRVVAEAGGGEEVLYADIDPGMVGKIRSEFTALDDRRLLTPHALR